MCLFFFKQKTAYEWRSSDGSSDVCSSDLVARKLAQPVDDLAADCQVELMDEPGFLRKGNDLERALAGIRVEPAERLVMVDFAGAGIDDRLQRNIDRKRVV